MDNYKIAFIHGNNFEEKGLIDGEIVNYGKYNVDSLHVQNLLDYANKNFKEYSIFQKLSIRHQPEVVSYFLTKLGIIVFLNMTKYDDKHLKKYGKSGMFLLPDQLTEKQQTSLIEFAKNIENFDVMINYDISIDTGILDSKTIQGFNHETPLELINVYLKRINNKNNINQK